MNYLKRVFGLTSLLAGLCGPAEASACTQCVKAPEESLALKIMGAKVSHLADLGLLVFEVEVVGSAGSITPEPVGKLDGAPVLGYVFPTTLKPASVGFGEVEGMLALAVTSHPDFDDTPLWDESLDGDRGNDGRVWHTHWVVLGQDERIGALAVKEFEKGDASVRLPPTNPGMPMYMDSPGFAVTTAGKFLRVTVPSYRMGGEVSFRFDAVAAYMQVNASDMMRPMLGVYKVYSVASGDLSLPYTVGEGRYSSAATKKKR